MDEQQADQLIAAIHDLAERLGSAVILVGDTNIAGCAERIEEVGERLGRAIREAGKDIASQLASLGARR